MGPQNWVIWVRTESPQVNQNLFTVCGLRPINEGRNQYYKVLFANPSFTFFSFCGLLHSCGKAAERVYSERAFTFWSLQQWVVCTVVGMFSELFSKFTAFWSSILMLCLLFSTSIEDFDFMLWPLAEVFDVSLMPVKFNWGFWLFLNSFHILFWSVRAFRLQLFPTREHHQAGWRSHLRMWEIRTLFFSGLCFASIFCISCSVSYPKWYIC